MRALWLVVCLMVSWPVAADVYEWVDRDGHKVYSDTPRPGARRVEMPPVPPSSAPAPEATTPPAPEAMTPPAGPAVPSLSIVRPANDETIYGTANTVEVRLAVEPPAPGLRFRVYLDGEALPELRTGTSFALPDVGRGSHTLQVAAVDSGGVERATAPAVTFHLWQASGIFNNPTWTFPKAPTAPTAPAAPRAP